MIASAITAKSITGFLNAIVFVPVKYTMHLPWQEGARGGASGITGLKPQRAKIVSVVVVPYRIAAIDNHQPC